MKKTDILVFCGVLACLAPFLIFPEFYGAYKLVNAQHPLSMAFLKFAVLATFGEVLGLRIKSGYYNAPGFGILPRAIVWGVLGVWMAAAMGFYRAGVPTWLSGFPAFAEMKTAMSGGFSGMKLCASFMISLLINVSFAPIFMVLHKITDAHIAHCGGSLRFLVTPIDMADQLARLNWQVQWDFVSRKTIPRFWIPAHTITFILPGDFQVLFAALLGIALGLILSIAAIRSRA